MPILQDLAIRLADHSKIEILLIQQASSSYRALLRLPSPSAKLLSWHESPQAHANAVEAFAWSLRHAHAFCQRAGTSIAQIENPLEGDLLPSAAQRGIAEAAGMQVKVTVNGDHVDEQHV